MGYQTYYQIQLAYAPPLTEIEKVPPGTWKEVMAAISELSGYDFDESGEPSDTYKWYDWSADMRTISEQFPSLLFTVCGDGEESDDKWKAYIVNGRMQLAEAEISYPEFDEKQLDNPKGKAHAKRDNC